MGENPTATTDSTIVLPENPVGYVAVLMAVITGVLHLIAATNAIEMSAVMAALFVLNGLGFLGGAALYLTRLWRRPLFLVAAVYSFVTIVALFPVQGWGVEAFYVDGALNPLRVITKAAEAVLVFCVLYLYARAGQ